MKTLALILAAAAGVWWFAGRSAAPPPEPAAPLAFDWPPLLDEPYPALKLKDLSGAPVDLSSYKGRVILLEPVGMTCAACQAFSGGNRVGGFNGVSPQADLRTIEEYAYEQAGVELADPRLLWVQLVLYNGAMQAPTVDELKAWAAHFGLDRKRNCLVLAADARMLGPESYAMVPGFHLIDRDFVFRKDSSGHRPKHDLYTELLPALGRLLAGKS